MCVQAKKAMVLSIHRGRRETNNQRTIPHHFTTLVSEKSVRVGYEHRHTVSTVTIYTAGRWVSYLGLRTSV